MVRRSACCGQCRPQLYGKLNLSLDKTGDYPDSAIAQSQGGLSDAWFVSSNSSRLGVRGEESLDFDNLRVIYQVEAGVDVDGDNSRTFRTPNSYLGLDESGSALSVGLIHKL